MKLKASSLFGKNFKDIFQSVLNHEYRFYTFAGGRNSLKSSFISITIIILVVLLDFVNVLVFRKVADTIKDSVYSQLLWAMDMLGVTHKFKCTVSPMKMTYLPTGQVIMFRGVDKPTKVKSIKLQRGYFACAWYEESSEFLPEDIRSTQQTILRGGGLNGKFWFFDSFNPPISARNWKNKELLENKPNRIVHHSTMLEAPPEWVGLAALEEAEHLRQTNERLYKNEILGIPTGTGANVFENIQLRPITDEEINGFEWVYRGIDWGHFPDPFVYCEFAYDAKERVLYIYKGFALLRAGNRQIDYQLEAHGAEKSELIIADNDNKDIADLNSWGWNIRAADKGSGSVDAGYKWLQTLTAIVIDNMRVPSAAAEFTEYEYLKDKNGEILSGYPQGQQDHWMSAVRYGSERIWKRRGY